MTGNQRKFCTRHTQLRVRWKYIRTHVDKEKDRELYESRIIVGLTNAGIMIHHHEDLVASPLYMIIRTYATEHR